MLAQLIHLYSLVILAAVVVSWTRAPRDHPAVQFLRRVTEPVLEPVRKILPPMGGVDFSPLVVLIGLRVLAGIL
jgi:YggT family protein